MRSALIAFFSLAAFPAASEPVLGLPIDCVLGTTCHVQQYVDRDPSEGYRDYTCGTLAYDGHTGTDFALPTLQAMQQGVSVLAAAPGEVRATRDGVIDRFYGPEVADVLKGKSCGNAVAIRHADGWETQYCHLKQGSVRVRSGDKVDRGTVLGEVGLSGKTQFPHLHLTVRHNGQVIDPFNTGDLTTCNTPGDTLWQDSPNYVPGALIDAGFSNQVPDFQGVIAGIAKQPILLPNSQSLVMYGFVYGGQKGDVVQFEISGPNGFSEEFTTLLKRTQSRLMRAYGKRLRSERWPSGEYNGIISLIRDGQVISQKTAETAIY